MWLEIVLIISIYNTTIDDIFFIWTHGKEQLNLFLKDLNEFHPNLKFPYETSRNSVDFLDLNASLKGGTIFTDLHSKPTDGHQFLHYKSSHPSHIKNLIPVAKVCELTDSVHHRIISMHMFLI